MTVKLRVIGLQTNSSFNKLCPMIYISTARVAIDHIGSFKSALLELFIRNLSLNLKGTSTPGKVKPRTCHQTWPGIPTDLCEFLFSLEGPPNILKFLHLPGKCPALLAWWGFWEPCKQGARAIFLSGFIQERPVFASQICSVISKFVYVSVKYDIPVKALAI